MLTGMDCEQMEFSKHLKKYQPSTFYKLKLSHCLGKATKINVSILK